MRDYDPTTGRYLQADPLGLIDGASVYGYVRQSPLMLTDPTGECPWCVWGAVFAAGLLYDILTDEDGCIEYHELAYYVFSNASGWKWAKWAARAAGAGGSKGGGGDNQRGGPGSKPKPEPEPKPKPQPDRPGKMQKEVERGQAPDSVDRVDKGRGPFEKDHVEFNSGDALNVDGSWKHGGRPLTNAEIKWLTDHGWTVPE